MLWRANMDLQYISETSLALTEYVSGYVTKAEKSNIQDIWNDISNSDSVYKRLFQFGMRSMRSRDVCLYEASDIILGDHLHEKSATVQWIGVDMHKIQIPKTYMLLASLITFIQPGLVNWKMFAFLILLPITNMMGLIKMVNESTEN